MKKLQVLKNKKGFTLVEIIVVLIILAILAATGIPSLVGFIADARGKAYVTEARAYNIAIQAIATEDNSGKKDIGDGTYSTLANLFGDSSVAYIKRLEDMLDPDITSVADKLHSISVAKGRVTGLIYVNDDYYVKMIPGQTAEIKKSPADTDPIKTLP